MTHTIKFDFELEQSTLSRLIDVCGYKGKHTHDFLARIGKAALREYIDMCEGKVGLVRVSDIKEHRLLMLIINLFEEGLPRETAVASLFHITSSQSRSLMRAVLDKCEHELKDLRDATLRDVLRKAQKAQDDNSYIVSIESETIVELLNNVLKKEDPTLPAVKKKADALASYVLKQSSYDTLSSLCQLTPAK